MSNVFFRMTAAVLGLALSACAASPPTRVAAAQQPASLPRAGVVHTGPDCGDDDGGFGAPVRHRGDATPFSENAFSFCWPQ